MIPARKKEHMSSARSKTVELTTVVLFHQSHALAACIFQRCNVTREGGIGGQIRGIKS